MMPEGGKSGWGENREKGKIRKHPAEKMGPAVPASGEKRIGKECKH